jgi:hypothetical protein
MAQKNGKKKGGGKGSDTSRSVLGNLSSTRPARMGRPRAEAPSEATAAPEPVARRPRPVASKPKAVAKPKTAASRPKAVASKPETAAGPRAVRSGSPSLQRGRPEPVRPAAGGGPPKGTELVTTAVQAAGELAQIGFTVGGQVLKRAVGRIPKP